MASAIYSLTIEQGASFVKRLALTHASDGSPYDLTGYTAQMQFRSKVESTDVLYELSTVNGRITIDATGGYVILGLTGAQTAGMTFASAVHDLKLYGPTAGGTGAITRLIHGNVTVSKAVTR